MKYNYSELKKDKLCYYCYGCNKLEIENFKGVSRCKELTKVEHANWIGISNQMAITTVLDIIQKLQEENKKKDKIIDEMTCELSKIEPFEYICRTKKNNNECEHCCNLCIKQYFEKKASDIDEDN